MTSASSTVRVLSTVVLVGGCMIAGCDGGDPDPASATATPSGVTSAAPEPTPGGSPTSQAPASQAAAVEPTAAPLPEEGLITEIEVLGGPDWLEADELGVWVKTDAGPVTLIDPVTHRLVDSVEPDPGGELCQGLGAGAGSIWSCVTDGVARIDPATRGGISVIPVAKTASQGELPVAERQLWVLTGDGSTLEGIDTAQQTVWSRFTLPVRGTDLEVGESGLWVVSTVDDAVVQVDMNTGRVLATIAVPAPVDVAVDHEVWVGTASQTVRLDPSLATIDLTIPAGVGSGGGIALTPGEVWVRSAETFLTRADRVTGAVVKTYLSDTTSGGDIIYAFGSIWTSASEEATVFRFAAPA